MVVSAWLVWTRSVANDSRPDGEIVADERASISEPGTILGLRPTFTPTPPSPATPLPVIDARELTQIVIVTPTPDPRRALTVGGAI
ncbi:MAG: hypothetical protein ACK4SA_08825, partial [Caldilinea sp.]